jgi:hypothetical protein
MMRLHSRATGAHMDMVNRIAPPPGLAQNPFTVRNDFTFFRQPGEI